MDHLLLLQDIPHSMLPLWPSQEDPAPNQGPAIPIPLPRSITQATTRLIQTHLTTAFLTATAPISQYRDTLHATLANDYTPAKVLQTGQGLLVIDQEIGILWS